MLEKTFSANIIVNPEGESSVVGDIVVPTKHLQGERLRKLQGVMAEAREEFPEIAGAVLYGSLVDGYTKESSDVDMCVFVDIDVEPSLRIYIEVMPGDRETIEWNNITFEPLVADAYQDFVRILAMQRLNIPSTVDLSDIKCLPISKEIVKTDIEIAIKYIKRQEEYETAASRWSTEISDNLYLPHPQVPHEWLLTKQMRSLFMPQVYGSDIDQYRKYVIEILDENPDYAEKIWRELGSATSTLMPDNASMPATFADAKRVYGS